MSIQLYNTLTNKKEPLETLEPGKVKMYVCGPTVYNKAHIGHAMSAMVFDIIRRYLEYRGYEVQFAMNFTDVDDKIIKRANEMGVDPFKLAEGYIDDFQQDMKDLNIKPATYNPRATQEIGEIIKIVQCLGETPIEDEPVTHTAAPSSTPHPDRRLMRIPVSCRSPTTFPRCSVC